MRSRRPGKRRRNLHAAQGAHRSLCAAAAAARLACRRLRRWSNVCAQVEARLWGQLTAEGDKAALTARRQQSVERAVRAGALLPSVAGAHTTHGAPLFAQASSSQAARAQAASHRAALSPAAEEAEWAAHATLRARVEDSKAAQLQDERTALAQWQRRAGDAEEPDEAHAAPAAAEGRQVPPPRAALRLAVDLTELARPELPARDPPPEPSLRDADATARRNAVAVRAEALDVSERHPLLLRRTGDRFLAAGSHEAALNAFRAALQLTEDAAQRCEVLQRCAECRRALCDDAGAAEDLRAACAAGGGASAADALAEVLAELEATPEALRKRGDALAAAGDPAGALALYGRVLSRQDAPSFERIAALANRAACRLSCGAAAAACDDVNLALATMLGGEQAAAQAADIAQAGAPQLDDREKGVLARLLSRRAAARAHMQALRPAAADARAAAALRRAVGEEEAALALEADAQEMSAD